jgi:hypothetical protein
MEADGRCNSNLYKTVIFITIKADKIWQFTGTRRRLTVDPSRRAEPQAHPNSCVLEPFRGGKAAKVCR